MRSPVQINVPDSHPPSRSDSDSSAPSNEKAAGPEGLWTCRDVASFLRVSRSFVYHSAASGRLPSLRMGGLLRFDPSAIRAFARADARGARR